MNLHTDECWGRYIEHWTWRRQHPAFCRVCEGSGRVEGAPCLECAALGWCPVCAALLDDPAACGCGWADGAAGAPAWRCECEAPPTIPLPLPILVALKRAARAASGAESVMVSGMLTSADMGVALNRVSQPGVRIRPAILLALIHEIEQQRGL